MLIHDAFERAAQRAARRRSALAVGEQRRHLCRSCTDRLERFACALRSDGVAPATACSSMLDSGAEYAVCRVRCWWPARCSCRSTRRPSRQARLPARRHARDRAADARRLFSAAQWRPALAAAPHRALVPRARPLPDAATGNDARIGRGPARATRAPRSRPRLHRPGPGRHHLHLGHHRQPKGVMLTHLQHDRAPGRRCRTYLGLRETDVIGWRCRWRSATACTTC